MDEVGLVSKIEQVSNDLWIDCIKEARSMVMGGSAKADQRGRTLEIDMPKVCDELPEILARAREIYDAAPSQEPSEADVLELGAAARRLEKVGA